MSNDPDNKDKADGILFSEVNGKRSDEHLHGEMLESVASVADEAGIRVLMEALGMTREEACQLVNPGKPNQPPSLFPGGNGNGEKSPEGI